MTGRTKQDVDQALSRPDATYVLHETLLQDGGGTITKAELADLMDTLGIEATPEEIDLMIKEIDQDSNGEIDFEGGRGCVG